MNFEVYTEQKWECEGVSLTYCPENGEVVFMADGNSIDLSVSGSEEQGKFLMALSEIFSSAAREFE